MTETRGNTFVMANESDTLSFSAFILGLASTALVHLGATPHPESNTLVIDLVLARQSIDVLTLLREKTRGNLTPDEEQLFSSVLTDLRMRFVEKSAPPK
jgi:hypothetical protein